MQFAPGLNLLSGPNGHGKTNLLEAIHYGCLAHSQRTRKDKELIGWNQDAFVIRLKAGSHAQSVQYRDSGHKRVKVNENESKRLSDLIGYFPIASFSPEDLDLIRGGPQVRRRFLDVLLCQFSVEYLHLLRQYTQTLKQRNSLLKQLGSARNPSQGNFSPEVLQAFDEPLIDTGTRLTLYRRRALIDLAPLSQAHYKSISDGGETLTLSLAGSVSEAEDEKILREDFYRKLQALRGPEREVGSTLAGPHREDLVFFLKDKSVRDYGSQGQKRSVALSVKLASAKLLEAKNGHPPILLLDDIFAELDEKRRQRIGELVSQGGQVFIANPGLGELPFKDFKAEKIITLHQGRVV